MLVSKLQLNDGLNSHLICLVYPSIAYSQEYLYQKLLESGNYC